MIKYIPVQNERLYEKIVEQIEKRITSGDLKVGDGDAQVRQQEMAGQEETRADDRGPDDGLVEHAGLIGQRHAGHRPHVERDQAGNVNGNEQGEEGLEKASVGEVAHMGDPRNTCYLSCLYNRNAVKGERRGSIAT